MMIDEIRRPDGRLFAFDVRSGYTTFRGLCKLLARYPGVEFTVPFIGTHTARFMFNGKEFEVCVPFSDYWVVPADAHAEAGRKKGHVVILLEQTGQ